MKDQLFKLLSQVSSDYTCILGILLCYSCSAIASPTESGTDDGSTGLPYVSVVVPVGIVISAAIVLIIVCVILVVMYRRKSWKFDIR